MNNWYGFEKGTNQHSMSKVFTSSNEHIPSNQTELAESYGITKQTMNNYMRMASMIPELEDLVGTGLLRRRLYQVRCYAVDDFSSRCKT